ncbi:GntR family transcriptional regulator [Rhodococcus sp. IEGM 1408]|uniref:GntR family transcriptional regulator n=1 Tax=Rhodococcus sp. IEGM 1408 TaxID=3082220 RepID=UPI002953D5BC|nr:GntR family transcriptional regulator [Rhodococcus sp. IEGM 1408]MDV7999878.1 GntR family transcriptional regulator [Rhodococcus sp. IEGM 1408]
MSSRRVRELIQASIRAGILNVDAQLVEEELMRIFNSSRGSVRDALNELREAGFVVRKPRFGTRVHRLQVGIELSGITATENKTNYITVLDQAIVPSFPLVRARLQMDEEMVRLVENTFAVDGEVIGLRCAYFSPRYDADPTDFTGVPLTMQPVFQEFFGVEPGAATVTVGVERCDERTARILGVTPGEALLSREILYTNADLVPVQIVFDVFLANRVRFEADTGRGELPVEPRNAVAMPLARP